jgi:mannose-1-phosphate guanylyltransferase/phosphomannomutase
VERLAGRDLVLVDGVKVLDAEGWTLVVPDPEEPITHVWVEAASEEAARARVEEQAARVRQLLA